MSTLAEKLHKWCLEELNLVSESSDNVIPDINSLGLVTKGKNKKLWSYVINHVRSQSVVRNIKRTLYIKKFLNETANSAYFNESSIDVVKLQSAVSSATEKRTYLLRNLSMLEERLLNLEEKNQNIKDEILRISQKVTLFEFLQEEQTEKNSYIKTLHSRISSIKNTLIAYQSAEICDKNPITIPYDFFNIKIDLNGDNFGIDYLVDLFSMAKENFSKVNDNFDAITIFTKHIYDLKDRGLLLTEIIVLLKEITGSDLQYITTNNIQSLPESNSLVHRNKKDTTKSLLAQIKFDNVHNSISAVKNKNCVEKLFAIQEETFKNKFKCDKSQPNDLTFELKCTLIDKLAENEALVKSNHFIDDYLNRISNNKELIQIKLQDLKNYSNKVDSAPKKFYKIADLTYYLMYTAANSFQKVLGDLSNLQAFVHNDIFETSLPASDCLDELQNNLISDRMYSWRYCDETNLMMTLYSSPNLNGHLLSPEVLKNLNLESFENISHLCENWMQIKQKLKAKAIAYSEPCINNEVINVPEINAKFCNILEKMKFLSEKSFLFISEGLIFCDRTKDEIQEWWKQNAQYIPHIEYEGKTLKMWIDILSVLSEFEPEDYPA